MDSELFAKNFIGPTEDERSIIKEVSETMYRDTRTSMWMMIIASLITGAVFAYLLIAKIIVSTWAIIACAVGVSLFVLAACVAIPTHNKCKKIHNKIKTMSIAHGTPSKCTINGSSCVVDGVVGDDCIPLTFTIDSKFLEPTCWDRDFICVMVNRVPFVVTTLPDNEKTVLFTHEVVLKK